MKKIKDKYLVFVLLGLTLLFLGLTYFIIDDNRNLTKIEQSIKDTGLVVQNIIYMPIKLLTQKSEKNESEQYDLILAELEEKNKQIEELKQLLELKNNLADYEKINATIINRNIGYFYDVLTIDKGLKAGIEEGMAVITYNGLIGKIIKPTNNTSTVKLLSSVNENYKISVKIETANKEIYGILSSYKDGKYILEGISDNSNIEQYSKVVTTGLDSLFPSGILIGYVDTIDKDNFDLNKTVYVTPSSSLDDISYVAVLKRIEQ